MPSHLVRAGVRERVAVHPGLAIVPRYDGDNRFLLMPEPFQKAVI